MNERDEIAALRAQLAALVHDIRGPLTSILGFAEMLEGRDLEGDAAINAAHTIRTSARRLVKLADDASASLNSSPPPLK